MVPLLLGDIEEESVDVSEVLVGREGVEVLWVTVSVAVRDGMVTEVGESLEVVWVLSVVVEGGAVYVDVCMVPTVEADGVTVDVGMLPMEEISEVLMSEVL